MIVTPDATVIGGSSQPGISIPGTTFMGQSAKPAKQPLTIDLLSETLHPRLKFGQRTITGINPAFWK